MRPHTQKVEEFLVSTNWQITAEKHANQTKTTKMRRINQRTNQDKQAATTRCSNRRRCSQKVKEQWNALKLICCQYPGSPFHPPSTRLVVDVVFHHQRGMLFGRGSLSSFLWIRLPLALVGPAVLIMIAGQQNFSPLSSRHTSKQASSTYYYLLISETVRTHKRLLVCLSV